MGYRTTPNWNNWSVNIKISVKLTRRPGGVVGKMPTAMPGSPGNREIITGSSNFFFFLQRQGRRWGPSSPLFNGCRAVFSRDKVAAA
jgi:hypothetical protein